MVEKANKYDSVNDMKKTILLCVNSSVNWMQLQQRQTGSLNELNRRVIQVRESNLLL